MQDLQIGVFDKGNRTNVTLADLNASLGRAFAALYWYSQSSTGLPHTKICQVLTALHL